MKDMALFIGWGGTHPGHEHKAIATFKRFTEALTEQKANGEIEDFEPVLLAPHGGELDGFVLVYGEYDKLARLQIREDMHRMQLEAARDHAKFSVIWALTGERVMKEEELIDQLVSEPVVV